MKTSSEQKQSGRLQNGASMNRRFGRRIGVLLAAGAVGLLAAGSGQAQYALPFYEPFPSALAAAPYNGFAYMNNEELGQSVTEANGGLSSSSVWNFGNSISSSCARIWVTNAQSGLEYPGLTNVDAAFQTGLLTTYARDTGSTKSRAAALSIPASNTNAPMSLYASFLLNIQTNVIGGNTVPFPFFGLTTNTTGTSVNQSGAAVYLNAAFQLQVSKNSTTAATNTTPALVASNTYLIVLRYKYNPGTNDQVDLWLDPTGLGADAVPPPTISTTNNNNLSTNFFGAVAIFQTANPPQIFIDEIRVATNWAGVTPTFPAPGNTYAVTGGGAGCAGGSFPVGLSGSDTGVSYLLYTNGLPAGQSVDGTGSAISFGGQSTSAIYTVLATNNANSNVGWMSGNATVSVLLTPAIDAQPTPVFVTTNGLAAFTFSPNGSGYGSAYQWYKNGVALTNGGHISGATTTNLVIFPAGTADAATTAAGYYAGVLANQCGAAVFTTTNALTLDTPANLIWVGDGNSNFWDVATSVNWVNPSSQPVGFNFGDNVTFDDSSAYPTVTLNSSFLSPSKITVDGSQNAYVFSGPGALAGSGSIVMNSTASLSLTTPNTETGGIVISNGVVNFNKASYLGTGIITLAGGQLAAGNFGAVYINNEIDVTGANSAIGVNSSGGQNLYLTNLLNGISGDLTFINNTSPKVSTPLVVLQYPNFTFNLPVDLNVGNNGGGLIVAGENTSGVQIWNGVISDAGAIERNGGGTTLLNNTNTFSGGVLLTNGSVGVGASTIWVSPATTPPTILSSPLGTGTLTVGTAAGNTPALFASGGPQMVGNNIAFATTTVGPAFVINGSNSLTLDGDIDLYGTNRTFEIDNTGATVLSGVIIDSFDDAISAAAGGLTKTGAGTLYLDCDETNGLTDPVGYPVVFGAITNSAGTLSGSGTLANPVVVLSGASIGGGDPGQLGTLTISNNLALGGNVYIRVNTSLSPQNDSIFVASNLTATGSGSVIVTNLGPALTVGKKLTLFNKAVPNGGALTVSGAKVNWNNNLASDGSISVASIIVPTISTAKLSGTNIVISGSNNSAVGTGGSYYVLTSTNITLPIAQWKSVATNPFATGGVFSITNPISQPPTNQFFLLEMP